MIHELLPRVWLVSGPSRWSDPATRSLFLGCSLIAPPAKLIRPAFGAGGDVETAVLVEVRDDHCHRVRPVRLQKMHFPFCSWFARILKPCESALRAPAGGDNVQVAVAVEISGDGLECLRETGGDLVFLPFGSESRFADVLVPCDLVRLGCGTSPR